MEHMTTVEAREHFSQVINRSAYGKERIVLTRKGKNIAVMVPLEDLQLIERLEDQLDVQDAKAALEEVKTHGTLSLDEFKKLKK